MANTAAAMGAESAPLIEAQGLHTYYGKSHVLQGVEHERSQPRVRDHLPNKVSVVVGNRFGDPIHVVKSGIPAYLRKIVLRAFIDFGDNDRVAPGGRDRAPPESSRRTLGGIRRRPGPGPRPDSRRLRAGEPGDRP